MKIRYFDSLSTALKTFEISMYLTIELMGVAESKRT
jgi:hypothetical protein